MISSSSSNQIYLCSRIFAYWVIVYQTEKTQVSQSMNTIGIVRYFFKANRLPGKKKWRWYWEQRRCCTHISKIVTFIGQWQGKLYVNLKWNTFLPIINPQLTCFPFTSYHYEVKSWLIISIYEKLNNHCLQNMNLHREIKYKVFPCKKNSKKCYLISW